MIRSVNGSVPGRIVRPLLVGSFGPKTSSRDHAVRPRPCFQTSNIMGSGASSEATALGPRNCPPVHLVGVISRTCCISYSAGSAFAGPVLTTKATFCCDSCRPRQIISSTFRRMLVITGLHKRLEFWCMRHTRPAKVDCLAASHLQPWRHHHRVNDRTLLLCRNLCCISLELYSSQWSVVSVCRSVRHFGETAYYCTMYCISLYVCAALTPCSTLQVKVCFLGPIACYFPTKRPHSYRYFPSNGV